ncbi:hypothetical protein ACP4OV_022004 [Aristida adscensionis]
MNPCLHGHGIKNFRLPRFLSSSSSQLPQFLCSLLSQTPSPVLQYKGSETDRSVIFSSLPLAIRDMLREVQIGSHTIQTHGASLARKHTHDWVVLIFLAAVVIALHYAPPFSRFVGKDMMTDIRYPVKQSTIPAWGVPIISILCPWAIFVSVYIARRDVYDLHHAALGVLFAVLITAVFTDVIKTAVGRPRPDFFWRCFPDGKQLFDQVTGDVICHGEKSFLTDGRKSFPSGHTSWSFAGLGFLSLYLIDDYRHHWEDVFVGGLIGYIMAVLCYLHFFPPPYHNQGWGPYAYFHMLEELQVANSHSGQSQHCTSTGGRHIGLSVQQDNRTPRNDLESGRV